MPPQVPRADANKPVNSQAPVQVKEPKSTEVDKNAAQKPEPPKQDAQTAAKNAKAAKQHAGGIKRQNVAHEQRARNKLNRSYSETRHSHPAAASDVWMQRRQKEIEQKMEKLDEKRFEKKMEDLEKKQFEKKLEEFERKVKELDK